MTEQLAFEIVTAAKDESTDARLADYVEWAQTEKRRTLDGPEWWNVFYAIVEPLRPVDSRDVPCPSCRARVGTFCKRPSGHTSKDSHAARWDAVLADAVLRATSQSGDAPVDGRGR